MSAMPDRDALADVIESERQQWVAGEVDSGALADAVIAAGWQPPTEPTAERCGRPTGVYDVVYARPSGHRGGCVGPFWVEPTAERAGDADDVATTHCLRCGAGIRVGDPDDLTCCGASGFVPAAVPDRADVEERRAAAWNEALDALDRRVDGGIEFGPENYLRLRRIIREVRADRIEETP